MVRRTYTLAVAGLAIVALAMTPALAGKRVVERYLTGTPAGGPFLPQAGDSFTLPDDRPNIGGIWTRVPIGTSSLDVRVVDDISDVVAADVLFVVDEYAPLIPSRRFCGSARGLSVPAGTKALYVRVVDLGSLACDPPGIPTMGTVTVAFR